MYLADSLQNSLKLIKSGRDICKWRNLPAVTSNGALFQPRVLLKFSNICQGSDFARGNVAYFRHVFGLFSHIFGMFWLIFAYFRLFLAYFRMFSAFSGLRIVLTGPWP